MASWTLPSLRPPITRDNKYVAKDVEKTQLHRYEQLSCASRQLVTYTSADKRLPIIVRRRMRLRPYLSLRAPMRGEINLCGMVN